MSESTKDNLTPYRKSNEEQLIGDALGISIELPISQEAVLERDRLLNYFLTKMKDSTIKGVANSLTFNPSTVLKLLYGIDTSKKGISPAELAQEMHVQKGMVPEMRQTGFRILKNPNRSRFLNLFVPYGEDSIAYKAGLSCPYDVISHKLPGFDPILESQYLEDNPPMSDLPFESILLSGVLPIEDTALTLESIKKQKTDFSSEEQKNLEEKLKKILE